MTLNDVFMTIRIGYDEKESVAAEIQCDYNHVRIFPELKDGSTFIIDCLLSYIIGSLQSRKERIDFEIVRPGDLK